MAISTETEAVANGNRANGRSPAANLPRVDLGVPAGRRALEILKRLFSFPAMLGTFLAGIAFYRGRAFIVDPDLWWHIKAGQSILATHHWPTTDPYSFTVHGAPWMAYEWGGEVLLGWVSRIGGVRALDLLLMALGAAILLALYVLGTVRSGKSKAGLLAAALVSPLATWQFTLRPQMLGYLFIVLTLIALELFRQGKRWAVWCLPALMLAWVNTHGSFIIGLGAIFLYWTCGLVEFRQGGVEAKRWTAKERRSLSLVFLLCLAVLPITPYGTRLAVYPFSMALSQPINIANILEWQSMSFNVAGGKIFLGLVLGFFLLQTIFNFTWRLEELALLFGGIATACLHIRFVMLFVPFCVPLLAVVAARWLDPYSRKKDKYVLNGILMAGVALAMVHYFPSRAALDEKVAENFPAHAVEYLREHHVAGPIFNSYGFGGYLVDAGYPTFIDGRADIFERGGVLEDYLRIARLQPGAFSILRNYGVESCLVERDEALSTALLDSPDWKRVFVDDVSALYVRRQRLARSSER